MPVRASLGYLSRLAADPCNSHPPSWSAPRRQVRRWVDAHTASFFTLSARDRQVLSAQKGSTAAATGAAETQTQVQPDRRTPVAFFKENPVLGKEGEKEVGKDGKAV